MIFGPPIPGAPWSAVHPGSTGGKGTLPPLKLIPKKPFVARVPSRQSDQRRGARFTEAISNMINSLAGSGMIAQTGPATFVVRTGSWLETRAPTVSDDVTTGVSVGNPWVNTATNQLYICVSNAQGAAVWRGPI